jgi:N6-L-threonylcarbamoyladenine synthase
MMPSLEQHRTRILAIETSCDETAVAVVDNGTTIVSNIVASQVDLHARYGGVFPEVASRRHIEVIYTVIDQALREAHLSVDDLDCIAVTRGPGLVGSLLVGVNAAKGMAIGRNKPILGINHIEGHVYSLWLTEGVEEFEFPIVTLVVSGGHTELYLVKDHLVYEHLGGTIDDAAGEAFDKVGRLLGLPFPGGPAIDAAAQDGDQRAFRFPRAVLDDDYNFSFSGLKTAVMRESKRFEDGRTPVADLAASFQAAVVDVLVTKTANAAEAHGAKAVHLAGGVSANRALRRQMDLALSIPVRYPPPILCTDNAAMIAAAAHQRFISGQRDTYSFDVVPGLSL